MTSPANHHATATGTHAQSAMVPLMTSHVPARGALPAPSACATSVCSAPDMPLYRKLSVSAIHVIAMPAAARKSFDCAPG